MARVVNVSGDDRKAAAAANEGFAPLPAGWYNATIFSVEEREFRSENYKGESYYNVQFRISEGDYAKRAVFAMVPLRVRWNPTEKSPDGFPTQFIPFFEALEYEVDGEFEVPDPDELAGQDVTIRLRVVEDTYAQEQKGQKDAKTNEVSGYRTYDPDDDPSPSREEARPARGSSGGGARGKRRKPAATDGWDV